MAVIFYEDINDTNLQNDLLIKQGDLYTMKYLGESTGTLNLTTGAGDDVLTDSTASYTIDGLISTTGLNFYIRDDNNALAVGKVTDNTATTITFDENDMVLVSDGVTAPTLSDGSTYSYRVLQPSTKYAYGEFFGYINELSWAAEQTVAEFKYSIPREKIREDLVENMHSINGSVFSTRFNIMEAMFGMTSYGSQSSQSESHFGTASFNSNYYQISIKSDLVDGRDILYTFFKVKFRPNGEIAFGGEDYKSFPMTFPVFKDTLRDSTSVDFGFYRQATT